MLVAGIDVGAEVHHVAVVDEAEVAIVKPTAFTEDLGGYEKLLQYWLEPTMAQTCPRTSAGATFWLSWRQPGITGKICSRRS
jgi:hypothetical protein